MSSFLRKSILFYRFSVRNLAQTINPNVFYSLRWFSVTSIEHSFTVSYLINSLGFSQQSALTVSKQVRFKTKDKPDKAIEFLRDYGFTQTQISKLVRSLPRVLIMNTQKTILPKLEFLESKGISRPELAKSLSYFPCVLQIGLGLIMAGYEFLGSIGMSDVMAATSMRRHPDILVTKRVPRNVSILQQHKVPNHNIAKLLRSKPNCFLIHSDRFREVVDEVVSMGFNASRMHFGVAVSALSMTKSNWDSKVDLYKKWGWSHEEFLEAFKREPKCMLASQGRISACMDFLTNQTDWVPRSVVKYPLIVSRSFETRVIPRCLVYQLLQSKGLVKKKKKRAIGLSSLLIPTEENFLKKFVTPYKNEAPELLKFYEEKMKLSNGSSSEQNKVSFFGSKKRIIC